jgi:hypothetical protein
MRFAVVRTTLTAVLVGVEVPAVGGKGLVEFAAVRTTLTAVLAEVEVAGIAGVARTSPPAAVAVVRRTHPAAQAGAAARRADLATLPDAGPRRLWLVPAQMADLNRCSFHVSLLFFMFASNNFLQTK